MVSTITEKWEGYWWRWYLLDGVPYAFLREGEL